MTAAEALLERLVAVREAAVEVRSPVSGGAGAGAVTATREGAAVVLAEAGEWTPAGQRPLRWRAVSRWHAEGEALAVEHVRQGTPARALLDRQPGGRWVGREPHLCGPDRYEAVLADADGALVLTWTVTGPCKMARIVTRYA